MAPVRNRTDRRQPRREPSLEHPPPTPWPLLRAWRQEAEDCPQIRYAHAVTLATSDLSGADARVVLVHEMDGRGLLLSSDEASAKAGQLRACPKAALVFHWGPLERQVRIRGTVEPASADDEDRCFEERPRQSRITAWASRQGSELPAASADARAALDRLWDGAAARFAERDEVPRPPHWRAWWLRPARVELWQARARRLHDRLVYEREPGSLARPVDGPGSWLLRRLAP